MTFVKLLVKCDNQAVIMKGNGSAFQIPRLALCRGYTFAASPAHVTAARALASECATFSWSHSACFLWIGHHDNW